METLPKETKHISALRVMFDRIVDKHNAVGNLTPEEKDMINDIWLLFEDEYGNAIMSMYGWKTCFESEQNKKRQAMDVIADVISIVTTPKMNGHA